MNTRNGRTLLLTVSVLVALWGASGCSRKPKPVVVPPTATETRQTETPSTTPQTNTEIPPATLSGLQDVFFDYDKSLIRGDQQTTLSENGKILLAQTGKRLVLEGHCDERGTVEYNLALGERRANAVRNYLVQYGVEAARLSTISYGEEKPFAQGLDETAWSQNRRVHLREQ